MNCTDQHRVPLFSALVVLILSSPVVAQTPRTNFVFHAYVDPTFGDNESAWELNPGNPVETSPGVYLYPDLATWCRWPNVPRPRPLENRDQVNIPYQDPVSLVWYGNSPHSAPNPNYAITGYLQHAPYSFRTLSGPKGAIDYINKLFDQPANSGAQLPWTHPSNDMRRVTHVIIHCLPGLYGPRNPGLQPNEPDIDPISGLPWNGEMFPIELGGIGLWGGAREGLTNRVSIQGTSALDTIFDGRKKDVNLPLNTRANDIFRVHSRDWYGTLQGDHSEAFIDGLTIRNAWSYEGAAHPDAHGIGIHIVGNGGKVRIRITNCFFVGNVVGVALDAFGWQDDAAIRRGGHEPILANNTFVGNAVSIWAGEITQGSPQPIQPYLSNTHDPLIINNVLRGTMSCFEGIRQQTLEIGTVNGAPIVPKDFNAWLPNLTNSGFVPAEPNWGLASIGFTPIPLTTVPRVDLTATGNLFVCDALLGALGIGDDYDYRLSPFASDDPKTPPGAMVPLSVNPLIGSGVNLAQPGSGGVNGIRNVSGNGFDHHPGLPDGTEEAPIHGWDYDCEGFGNPRLLPRSGVMPSPPPPFGTIDIGADQCGGLIMAGYVPGTRMFVGQNPITSSTLYDRCYYVDVPNQIGLPRPDAGWTLGGKPWYDNAQMARIVQSNWCSPNGPIETYYTEGEKSGSLFTARALLYLIGEIGPFPRNLACDFSPSLLVDIHGFWGDWFASFHAAGPSPWGLWDPYSSNPIFHASWNVVTQVGAAGPLAVLFYPDNPSLFHNKTHASPHGPVATWPTYQNSRTWVTETHLNPPGTFVNTGANLQYLLSTSGQFGPFDPACGTPTFATGLWGLNDLCPDPLPPLQLDFGIRINCEIPRPRSLTLANTNLQTFLLILNGGSGLTSQALSRSAQQGQGSGFHVSPAGRLALASILNIPACLGTEVEFASYCEALTRGIGAGQ